MRDQTPDAIEAGAAVDSVSPKGFERTVADLRAELASPATRALLSRLSADAAWDATAPPGAVRARRLVIGPPRPARPPAASAAGTLDGLLPPAPIAVWEDDAGAVRVAYVPLAPALMRRGRPAVGALAELVDGVRARLAAAAVATAAPQGAPR